MSENQVQDSANAPESVSSVTKTVEQPVVTSGSSSNPVADIKSGVGSFLNSWKLKLGLVVAAIAGMALLSYLWPHIIATQGLKGWAKQSEAKPLTCMMQDTNDDGYVSCSAILDEQIVSLQCSSSLLNMGCRVNYGSVAPPAIKIKKKAMI
ncbi:MAG: hypothetical protein ACRC8A_01665 [Microcoleaceae cyanobacterium]